MLEIAATKYCKPKVPITLKEHKTFDGKIVMECNINKGSELPYLCRNIKGEWKVYYREDDECKLASIVRYTMMTLQNGVKNSTIFTEKDQEVMELIRGYPEGVNKNVVSRKLKIEYRLTVSILARLMYLGMLKESKKLNTTLYTVV